MTNPDVIYETIILGSGPAGLTAAIYAGRSRCCPLLIHGVQPGGQLTTTTAVDNFPGFPEGIDGPDLMENMRQQAERFGARFVEGEVTRVDLQERPFRIWIGEVIYRCLSLIISTGASPKLLGLGNEESLYGRGVSICATCDGFFYRDREVVVVGGGDTAMEEAVFLTRFASKVTVVHRRDSLRATPFLADRALTNKSINFIWDSVLTEILEDSTGVTGIRTRNLKSGDETELACDGVPVAGSSVAAAVLGAPVWLADRVRWLVGSIEHFNRSLADADAAASARDARHRPEGILGGSAQHDADIFGCSGAFCQF